MTTTTKARPRRAPRRGGSASLRRLPERAQRWYNAWSVSRREADEVAARLITSPTAMDLIIWTSHAHEACIAWRNYVAARSKGTSAAAARTQPTLPLDRQRRTLVQRVCAEFAARCPLMLTPQMVDDLATMIEHGSSIRGRSDLVELLDKFHAATRSLDVRLILPPLCRAFPTITHSLVDPANWSRLMNKQHVADILDCDARIIEELHPGVMGVISRQRFRIRLDLLDEPARKRYGTWCATHQSEAAPPSRARG